MSAVGEDLADRPFQERTEGGAELGIVGKVCVAGRLHEASDGARAAE
jgi:hypothetical protein